jgi:hypothetical protein
MGERPLFHDRIGFFFAILEACMVFMSIDDAPFTDEEKKAIKQLGIAGADWGHPEVVLADPVAYFQEQRKRAMAVVKVGGAGLTRYELYEDPQPFETK